MKLLYKILFLISFSYSFGQSSTCANAAAMCSGNQGPFNNTTGVASFGSLGCLGSTPNPAWFYMQVGTSGTMNFQLSQIRTSNGAGIDVDFILWGPFNTLSGICNNLALYSPGYTGANNVVACSYSTAAIENFTVPNAVAGQFYMLLVTNFSGQAGTYTLNQTGGTGALSCDIVCGVRLGPDRILCGAATSVTLTASFLQAPAVPGSPVYSWYRNGVFQYTTTTNSTIVNQSGTWRVSVTRPGCSDVAIDDVEVQFIGVVPFNSIGPINAPTGECNPIIDLTSYQAALVAPYDPASFTFVYYDSSGAVITNPTSFSPTSSTFIGVEISAGPCSNFDVIDINITCIPPTCTLALTSAVGTNNQTLCQGVPLTNIVYTTSGSATDATVTGLPSGLTTSYASNTFTISGTPTQTGSFNYTVTTVGCTVNATQNGTINIVPVPSIPTISSIASSCSVDGSSIISNYNSGVTYVFTPTGPSVISGGEIMGMVTGTSYTVLATNGTCTSVSSTSFSNNAMLATPAVPLISSIAPTCSENGSSTITNYDANNAYSFTPSGPTVGVGGLISAMTVGTSYTVTTTNGVCTSAASLAFSNLAQLITPSVPAISNVAPTCVANGSSSVSNYNASNTYVFSPSGPSVGAGGVISGMTLGTSYIVTASNGSCTSVASSAFSNLAQLTIPVAPVISVASPTCLSNGVATITNYVSGLTYLFTPTGPTVNISGVISGMTVGTSYTVIASNGNCNSVDSSSFSINGMLASPAIPTITTVGPTCVIDGSSSISNYDGSLTYTFTPTGPTVGIGGVITGMITGTNYTVVSNNGTCTSASSASFSNALQLTIPIVPTVSIASPTCSSNGIATITNYVSSGITYVFTPSGPIVNASGVISGMTVGVNYVVAASNGSCASVNSSSFAINAILATPAIPTIVSVSPTCVVSGSSSISNYDSTLTYVFSPSGPSVDGTGLVSGMTLNTMYTVTASNATCSSLASVSFSNLDLLVSPVSPTLSVVNSFICSGETAIFQINGTPNNVVTYVINGGSNQMVTLTAQGSATVEFTSATTNVVIELSNISNGNCSLSLSNSATVTVEPCSIPKGVSPNGDGLNDTWDLSNYNIKKVEIFNRYGTKVYSKSNYENEWYGQSDNGNELPDGTYYFVIDFTDLDTKTGWIYINRER